MIRARFTASDGDYRPVVWPVKYPYWCSGYNADDRLVVVAYADDEQQIMTLWPDAVDIESEPAEEIVFTGRFPKPDWYKGEADGQTAKTSPSAKGD